MSYAKSALESTIESRVLGPVTGVEARMQERPIVEIIQQIRQGVHGNCLRRLSGAIPRAVLSDTLGTDLSNLAKIYHRKLSRLETEQINDLSLLWYELREFFKDDERLIKTWLSSPTPILTGIAPQALMGTIIGRQILRGRISAMREGNFT